jgi:hypothetical protein
VQAAIHLEVAADGFVPLSFVGTSGAFAELALPDGTLFGMPEAEHEAWRATFAGCPGADAGGMVVGTVRVGINFDPTTDPLDPSARAFVETVDGLRFDACYRDEAGYVPGQETTGDAGVFAIFGVPSGLHRLQLYRSFEGSSVGSEWRVWVPEDGAVSMQPVFLEL